MNQTEIAKIIDLHKTWLARAGGAMANLSRANLSGADLSGADLSRANLSRADLSGADLSRANLSGADLSRANLSGADLSRANLFRADLSGANLFRADLSGADLSGADLSGADLSRANLYAYASVGFSSHGEMGRILTAIRQTADSDIYFCCGCFRGDEADLREYISNGEAKLKPSRILALKTVLALINYTQK
jgi:uncharacterized protein YjbI with pentapeptide repeats